MSVTTNGINILKNPQADIMRQIIHGQMIAMIDNYVSINTINSFVHKALNEITDDISIEDFVMHLELIKRSMGLVKRRKNP